MSVFVLMNAILLGKENIPLGELSLGNENAVFSGTTNVCLGYLGVMNGRRFWTRHRQNHYGISSCFCSPTMEPCGGVSWSLCRSAISRFPISRSPFGQRLPKMDEGGS